MIIWMKKILLLRCEILLYTLYLKQNKQLLLFEFAALNLFCYSFALLVIITLMSDQSAQHSKLQLTLWRNMKRNRSRY